MRKRLAALAVLTLAALALSAVAPAIGHHGGTQTAWRSSWGRAASAVLPGTEDADAYLHLANAQEKCGVGMQVYSKAWFENNGWINGSIWEWLHPGSSNSPNHSYTRDGDNDIYVMVSNVSSYQAASGPYAGHQGEAIIICHVQGADPGGITFASGFPMWMFLGAVGGYSGPLQGAWPAWWVS